MNMRFSNIIALVTFVLLLTSCVPSRKYTHQLEPTSFPPTQSPTPLAPSTGQASSVKTSKEVVVDSPQAIVEDQSVVTSIEPIKNEEETFGVKLTPAGEFSDDDLIMTMTILKMELGVRPELKMTDISRVGIGKSSKIIVGTKLSSTKPLVSIINALLNRDRFEGRLGDKVLFTNNDLRFVCKIPACAGVEDMSVCHLANNKHTCSFAFGIVLFNPASERIGDAVKGLPTTIDGNETIVAEPIRLYLNNEQIDYVYVPADTAGTPVTDMTISGNASGPTPKEAQQNAITEMDRIRDKMSKKIIPVEMKVEG